VEYPFIELNLITYYNRFSKNFKISLSFPFYLDEFAACARVIAFLDGTVPIRTVKFGGSSEYYAMGLKVND